jgi:two-component system cell cycle response regulator
MTELKNKRVLVVDDEEELTRVLARRLSAGWGFEVSVAHDGAEGLRKAASFRPDVILLDLAMPEVGGWEMCRRLRADPDTSRIPVVIMTAWDSKDLAGRGEAAGAAKILLKPIDERELLAELRTLAGGGHEDEK